MNEEELKLLNKLDDLPNKLNLEIRGLILAEVMLRKENQKLKKQLEEHIKAEMKMENEIQKLEGQDYTVIPNMDIKPTLDKYKNQQKEFIEYLEGKINMCDGFLDTIKNDLEEISYAGRISGKNYIATQIMKNETAKKNYEEVLSKYKEITGGDNK